MYISGTDFSVSARIKMPSILEERPEASLLVPKFLSDFVSRFSQAAQSTPWKEFDQLLAFPLLSQLFVLLCCLPGLCRCSYQYQSMTHLAYRKGVLQLSSVPKTLKSARPCHLSTSTLHCRVRGKSLCLLIVCHKCLHIQISLSLSLLNFIDF